MVPFVMCPTDAPTGKPDEVLQSGCSDCMVLKGNSILSTVMLISKENRGVIFSKKITFPLMVNIKKYS